MKTMPEFFYKGNRAIPYFYFMYPGKAHRMDKDKYNRFSKENTEARRYYLEETFNQYDFSKIKIQFKCAVLITIDHFKSDFIRDLDNINRKPIVDAIKRTTLIPDDSYQHLSHFHLGRTSGKSYVEAYLIAQYDFIDFLEVFKLLQNKEIETVCLDSKQEKDVIKTRKNMIEMEKESLSKTYSWFK